jgi:folate-dependent phosphoribosylglycinamide formyltransferase PurN
LKLKRKFEGKGGGEKLSLKFMIDSYGEFSKCELIEYDIIRNSLYRAEFPSDLKKTLSEKADIVVLLGFNNLISEKSLWPVKNGIISFHPADTNEYRGRPGTFFEWLYGEPKHGLTLQRLNKSIDGGEIICQRFVEFNHRQPFLVAKADVRKKLEVLWPEMVVEGLSKIERGDAFSSPRPCKVSVSEDSDRWPVVRKYIARSISVRLGRLFG